MNKRRMGAAALTVGVFAALTACSPGGGEAEGGDQELLIWDTGLLARALESGEPDVENSFLHQVAADFEEENPGVTVEIVQQTGDISANGAQFQAASIAGNGPDIRIQYAGGPTLSYEEFFADLTDVIPQETVDAMTGWNTLRSGYAEDGAIVGMPYGAGLYFTVFSNNEKLEAAGMDPTDYPETWEELMEKGQEFKDATDEPAFWVANLEGYTGAWVIGAFIGGELGEQAATDMYNGDIRLDDPAVVKAYQAWADFGASGLVNEDAGEAPNGPEGFVSGTGAYYIVGSWENANMVETFGEEVETFFIPVLEGAEYPSAVAGGPQIGISITEYSERQELAGEFLNYLAQPEVQDRYVEMYQIEASNHAEGDPSIIENRLLQEQAVQLQEVDQVVFPFDSVMPQPVIDLFYRLNASTFLGTTSPEDAAAQLQAANETELSGR